MTEGTAPKKGKALLIVAAIIVVAAIVFVLFRNPAAENGAMDGVKSEDRASGMGNDNDNGKEAVMETEENDTMMEETPPQQKTSDPGSAYAPDKEDGGPRMATESQGTVKTIAVEGGSFRYQPNEIRVKKGEKVKIVLSSKDMVHDFVVDELGIRTAIIKAGDTGMVEFTANTTGTFEFYCSVGQHRKNGMVGKLIVE